MYTKIINNAEIEYIKRNTDNAWIPLTEENIDYKEYLNWLLKGNIPKEIVIQKEDVL